jgi:hypothetical protein
MLAPAASAEELAALETLLDEELLGWAPAHHVVIRCIALLGWPEYKTKAVLRAAERVTTSRVEIVRKPGGPYVTLAP